MTAAVVNPVALFRAEKQRGGFGSTTNMQLFKDVPQVITNCHDGDVHLVPDLFV